MEIINETLIINKALTIKGEPGAKIQGSVTIAASGVTLEGLTVKGHSGEDNASIIIDYDSIADSSDITITNCELDGNGDTSNAILAIGSVSKSELRIIGNEINNYIGSSDDPSAGINLSDVTNKSNIIIKENNITIESSEEGLENYGIYFGGLNEPESI